ncbi:Protein of unknown function (DUF3522) [seawater metagenome]|uniref:Haemolysin-III related n=1 Tax=seawater metagenome TaxID=1561972 RepID=A0A5E8CHU3_9ZZZZ
MITGDFLWLILSHLTVVFPIYIGLKENIRRWLPVCITLFFTSIFSSIYHWVDQDNFDLKSFEFLGNSHEVYANMDFFCSYLSIFLTVFYTINPLQKPRHLDISLIIIVLISAFVSFIVCTWYAFTLIVTGFSLFYLVKSKDFKGKDIISNIKKNIILTLFATGFLITGIVMQYYFAIYQDPYYYRVYHGFWHFFMFLSSGLWIVWNEKFRQIENIKILCIPV